jgi:hypothetical protein
MSERLEVRIEFSDITGSLGHLKENGFARAVYILTYVLLSYVCK